MKDEARSGEHGGYHWIVCREELAALPRLVVRNHLGLHLCITSFDSGPLKPSDEEREAGWFTQGAVMVSPPLREDLPIPCDLYDEWYLLQDPALAAIDLEVFVNYGAFSLVPPSEHPDQDLGFLEPIQDRFWGQIAKIGPETFVAMGDNTVVASRRPDFIERVRRIIS